MTLRKFDVSYLDRRTMVFSKLVLAARDEAQVRNWIDQRCPPEHRLAITFGIKVPDCDSLKIEHRGAVTTPIILAE